MKNPRILLAAVFTLILAGPAFAGPAKPHQGKPLPPALLNRERPKVKKGRTGLNPPWGHKSNKAAKPLEKGKKPVIRN